MRLVTQNGICHASLVSRNLNIRCHVIRSCHKRRLSIATKEIGDVCMQASLLARYKLPRILSSQNKMEQNGNLFISYCFISIFETTETYVLRFDETEKNKDKHRVNLISFYLVIYCFSVIFLLFLLLFVCLFFYSFAKSIFTFQGKRLLVRLTLFSPKNARFRSHRKLNGQQFSW